MRVYCLLTIPPGHSLKNCTLVLDTIRVGFPNAMIYFYVNGKHTKLLGTRKKALSLTASFSDIAPITHFKWIRQVLLKNQDSDEPIAFVDGDMSFWGRVEDVDLVSPICGMYIPSHISDYSRSFYFDRLHTCFLFIRSPKELLHLASCSNPRHGCHPQFKPYLVQDLVSPSYEHINGQPVYYDTCAKLYHAIGGYAFPNEVLDQFDHLNSASFYQAMLPEFTTEEARNGFVLSHSLAENHPQGMPGLRKGQEIYYQERAIRLHDYLYPNSLEPKSV